MSRFPPTPWEVVEGAPNGEAWVCAYAPITQGGYDEAPEQEDTRLFAAPPSIAAEVVRRVNAHEALGAVKAQRDRLRAALEQALASLRELRGLAWTGSRIPPHLYPEYGRANAADNAARAALKETT